MPEPFRLARVLRLREQIRKLRSHEAEQLAARLGAAHVAAERLAGERERCGREEAAEAAAGLLTPHTLQVGRAYAGAVASAEQAQLADIARLTVALDAKRAELLRERQEEEKYVRLAEAHRQRVVEAETHETERTLDEIAIDRHRRGRKERNDARR